MKSSVLNNNTDALTSLISYAPPLLFNAHHPDNNNHPSDIDINQFTTPSDRHITPPSTSTHPSTSPNLEIVSARHLTFATTTNTDKTANNQIKPSNNNNNNINNNNNNNSNDINTNHKDISNKQSSAKQTTKPILTNNTNTNIRIPHHKKKKTVAFGRTVNVSQTVEGSKAKNMSNSMPHARERRDSARTPTNEELTTIKQTVDELKDLVDQLKQNDLAKDKLIAELETKCATQERELLELSDMMKNFIKLTSPKQRSDRPVEGEERILTSTNRQNTRQILEHNKNNRFRRQRSGKENIPPGMIEELKEAEEEELRRLMLRKWEENEEFKRYVQQGLMKYGGDASLDAMVGDQVRKKVPIHSAQREVPTGEFHREDKQPHQMALLKSTNFMKQTTIHCLQSNNEQHQAPTSSHSNAFSFDSRKYLARYGISGALNDDKLAEAEDQDQENAKYTNSRSVVPLESVYERGQSITYYPSRYHKYNTDTNFTDNNYCSNDMHLDGNQRAVKHNTNNIPRRPKRIDFEQMNDDSDELLDEPVDLDDRLFDQSCGRKRLGNTSFTDSPMRTHPNNRYGNGTKYHLDRSNNRTFNNS